MRHNVVLEVTFNGTYGYSQFHGICDEELSKRALREITPTTPQKMSPRNNYTQPVTDRCWMKLCFAPSQGQLLAVVVVFSVQ